MLKPFSALKFFKENKRKSMTPFIVLSLSIAAISLITVLINSIRESYDDILLQPLTQYSIVQNSENDLFLKQSIVDSLQSNTDIENLIKCDVAQTNMNLAIGFSGVLSIFTNKSDIKYILSKTNTTLKDGRLPDDDTNEIVVHQRLMSNKNWVIGQTVGSDKDEEEWLSGTYTISGIIDGSDVMIVGTQSNRQRQYIKNYIYSPNPIAYIVFPKDNKLELVNEKLEKIDKNDATTTTYKTTEETLNKSFQSINLTLTEIILIVTIILSISVSSLMFLLYLQRSNEFGVLIAMGYERGFVYRLILKEVLSLNLICWIIGITTGIFIVYLLNYFIYNPSGNYLNFFSANVLINTLYIPIVVPIFSALPILMKIHTQDPIEIIERHD